MPFKNDAGVTGFPYAKKKFKLNRYLTQKLNLRGIIDLNVRGKTLQLVKECVAVNLYHLG